MKYWKDYPNVTNIQIFLGGKGGGDYKKNAEVVYQRPKEECCVVDIQQRSFMRDLKPK